MSRRRDQRIPHDIITDGDITAGGDGGELRRRVFQLLPKRGLWFASCCHCHESLLSEDLRSLLGLPLSNAPIPIGDLAGRFVPEDANRFLDFVSLELQLHAKDGHVGNTPRLRLLSGASVVLTGEMISRGGVLVVYGAAKVVPVILFVLHSEVSALLAAIA